MSGPANVSSRSQTSPPCTLPSPKESTPEFSGWELLTLALLGALDPLTPQPGSPPPVMLPVGEKPRPATSGDP